MASQVDEECFVNYFASDPELKIYYIITNLLYAGNLDRLSFKEIKEQFQVSLSTVKKVVDTINQCIPDTLHVKKESCRRIIITELGRKILLCDIIKLVPQEGILYDDLKKTVDPALLNHLISNWLKMYKNSDGKNLLVWMKYSTFTALHASLLQFRESHESQNMSQKTIDNLLSLRWIKIINVNHEIRCKPSFPLTIDSKLSFLCKLAEEIYRKMLVDYNDHSSKIKSDMEMVLTLQSTLQKEIDSHNEKRLHVMEQHRTLLMMRQYFFRSEHIYAKALRSIPPQAPSDVVPGIDLIIEPGQPQPSSQ